jgi:hypothetical protein
MGCIQALSHYWSTVTVQLNVKANVETGFSSGSRGRLKGCSHALSREWSTGCSNLYSPPPPELRRELGEVLLGVAVQVEFESKL